MLLLFFLISLFSMLFLRFSLRWTWARQSVTPLHTSMMPINMRVFAFAVLQIGRAKKKNNFQHKNNNVWKTKPKYTNTNTAIFIPISERFFLSSRTGLWRLCRYALTPILLTNSTLPQILTKLIVTNATEIDRLKKDIANEMYIGDWSSLSVPIANVTAIDNRFKQALFANWVRDTADFPKYRTKYRALSNPTNATNSIAGKQQKKVTQLVIANHNLTEVQEIFGLSPIHVQLNGSNHVSVIVPRSLQLALFDEWPQKHQIIYLLGKFAKDMDLSTNIVSTNGSQLVFRPPDPPTKGQQNADYRYIKYGMHFIAHRLCLDSFSKDFSGWD